MGDCLRVSPERVGIIHFIGIGGIGMSGIAAILRDMGYSVRGSDISESPNVLRLREQGIEVIVGHDAMNIRGASVIVVSSDIQASNSELQAARSAGIPVVKRAEMLAELMRLKPAIAIAGSHGKTTTTSLLAHVMDTCHQDPTIVCGGIIEAMGSNARIGSGSWIVVEADESDGSFNKLPATIAVVTSIDPEHMTYYKDFETLVRAFGTFTENVPFYGLNILCFDHPAVGKLAESITDRRLVTYGLTEGADLRATNVTMSPEGSNFDLQCNGRAQSLSANIESVYHHIQIPLIGPHNIQNTLAVIAVALELGLDLDQVFFALKTFKGVRRRFTLVGKVEGASIIDDYAHHPVEIECVLRAAKIATGDGKVIAVLQPHRYTRLNDLFEDFSKCLATADLAVVTPVYAAGEQPIAGIDHHKLVKAVIENGFERVWAVENFDELVVFLNQHVVSGDIILCLGAGSITRWAADLLSALEISASIGQRVGT